MNTEVRQTLLNGCIAILLGLFSMAAMSDSTWSYTYNNRGQVLTMDGPRMDSGDITSFSYDAQGNLTGIRNALGHVIQLQNHNSRGQPERLIDANAEVNELTYHPRGWLLTTTVKDSGGNSNNDAVTKYEYDHVGQITGITLPDGSKLQYQYDAGHRLIAISNSLGERIEYTLDSEGNKIGEEVKSSSGAITRSIRRTYDELSRMLQVTEAGKYSNAYHYDDNGNGNVVAAIDGNTNQTAFAYDALNQLINLEGPLNYSVDYSYDALGNLTEVVDARNLITGYRYDGLGNPIQRQSPDTGMENYWHDAAGNLTSKTDAIGTPINYSYDALNRVTDIDYPGTQFDIRYIYDNCLHGMGRLCVVNDGYSQTRYHYDSRGRPVEVLASFGSHDYTIRYRYDANGRLLALTYPSGRQVSYRRDTVGRIVGVTNTWSGVAEDIATNITYLPFGPLQGITYGNGLREQHSHDLAYRLTGQIIPGVQQRVYQYDPAGNVLVINQQPGRRREYRYDALQRLTEEIAPNGESSYTYDANSNRLSRVKIDQRYDRQGQPTKTIVREQSYNYPPDSHQLSAITTVKDGTLTSTSEWHHDATGKLLGKYDERLYHKPRKRLPASRRAGGNRQFSYNATGRLESISKAGRRIAEYRYNPRGERIAAFKYRRSGIIHTRHYHYDQQGRLLGITRYNKAGKLKANKDILWLDDRPLAQVTTRYQRNGKVKARQLVYLHTDQINTPRIATDADQAVVWRWDSDAFGSGKPDTDPDKNGRKTHIPLRFPGQVASEDGLFYNYQRYYDPSTGRYITSDPIGLQGGLNTYAYVGGNPLNYIDPTGELICGGACILGAAIIAYNSFETANDFINAANVFSDNCSSTTDKATALGIIGLGVVDFTPGDLFKKAFKFFRVTKGVPKSPNINPKDIVNKTPEQIDKLAKDKGLIPKGSNPQAGKGSYLDPATGKQRVLCHPNCSNPHGHVNNPGGQRLDINGNIVPSESPAAHLPIKLP